MAHFFYKILIGFVFFLVLIACNTAKQAVLLPQKQQGIEGQIFEKIGNNMPQIGKPISKGKPYFTTVYFYQPFYANVIEQNPTNLLSKCNGILVDSVATNSDGFYKKHLPPGYYSVVVGYEGQFYAGFLGPSNEVGLVKVEKGVFQKNDITIHVKASY
ncbi:MAG: hypothetical protein EBV82_01090 [Chitinophagia bacterium]|jgi:hypothetical protein|nr:hypothetical protein [Chitinophagia bacterium]